MLDSDLARLYGVETKALNRAVGRNQARFAADFMVQLTTDEADLAARLDRLEKDYDVKFKVVFDAIRQLMLPPSEPPRKRIGYRGG